jgi:uncharacterized alpha-E superfamily protein
MLSRVADALFWMSRYLERAEHVARLLDVCFHLELDLSGLLSRPHELHWTSLAVILQQIVPPSRSSRFSPQAAMTYWLTFDQENPSSILSCVSRARANARSIRGTISSEMWRELNKLYLQLMGPELRARAEESPHELYQAIECASALFQGVCDATLTHDEGWQFIQLGKYLERADKTLRILDVQYHLLLELTDPLDLPLSNLQWARVLRSCRAYEAYQRLYVGRVDPERVVEFLLLHLHFPHSVRFCLEAAAAALEVIEEPASGRQPSRARRILGRILSTLEYGEVEEILQGELHTFLGGILEQCTQVSRAVQEQFALHLLEGRR